MIYLKFICFAVISIFGATVSSYAAEEGGIVNEYCPVTPEELVESHITTEYQGEVIGFCCKSCKRKFLANPEVYSVELPVYDGGDGSHHDAEEIVRTSDSPEGHSQESYSHDAGHDHAADHEGNASSILVRVWGLTGKLHVVVVHLPIALLPLAALLELMGILRHSGSLQYAGRINFILGVFSAIIAAFSGWVAKGHSSYSGELVQTLEVHQVLGFSTVVASLVGLLSLVAVKIDCEWGLLLYRAVLLIVLILVPLTGHFGGSLIYGPDYFNL